MNTEHVEAAVQALAEHSDKVLQGKASLYEARGLDADAMEGLYAVAHSFYSNGKYQDALKIFRLLCLYDHNNVRYWLGLGYTQKMLKEYTEALVTLTFALVYLDCGDETAEAYLHTAECCSCLGRWNEARDYATEAMKLSDSQPFHNRAEAVVEAASTNLN